MRKLLLGLSLGFYFMANGQCSWSFNPIVDSVKTNYFSSPPTVKIYGKAGYTGFEINYIDSYLDANNVVNINVFWTYCANGFPTSYIYYDITEGITFSHPQEFDIRINNILDSTTVGVDSNGCVTNGILDTCLMTTYFFPYGYNVSLSELTEESISVSPNPARDEIHVQTSEAEQIQQLVLQDITGKEVKRVVGNVSIMDVNELPSGTYFLLVETKRGVFRKKVMIK